MDLALNHLRSQGAEVWAIGTLAYVLVSNDSGTPISRTHSTYPTGFLFVYSPLPKSLSAAKSRGSRSRSTLNIACRTECEQTTSVGAITSSGSLRDGLEISVKCHVQRENFGPFRAKTGLAYVLVRNLEFIIMPSTVAPLVIRFD